MEIIGRRSKERGPFLWGGCLAVICAAVFAGPAVLKTQAVESSFSVCVECHDTMAGPFGKNPHASADMKGRQETVCEACHGSATVHMESGGGGGNIFAFKAEDAPGDSLAKCRACHAAADDLFASSLHQESSKTCLACHRIHPEDPEPGLLTAEKEKVCASCHDHGEPHMTEMNEIVQVEKRPLACLICHDPHSLMIR